MFKGSFPVNINHLLHSIQWYIHRRGVKRDFSGALQATSPHWHAQRAIYTDYLYIDKPHWHIWRNLTSHASCGVLNQKICSDIKMKILEDMMKYEKSLTLDPASERVRRAERAGGWGARLKKTTPSSSPRSSSRSESWTALGDETQTP